LRKLARQRSIANCAISPERTHDSVAGFHLALLAGTELLNRRA